MSERYVDRTPPPLSVFYATYRSSRRRTLAHVVAPAEHGPRRQTTGERQAGFAFCRIGAYGDLTVVERPYELPSGVTWCPRCVGAAAEALGVLDVVAGHVTAALGLVDSERRAREAAAACP